ncbi:PPE family protein, SVP subgroup [Mycobacterium kansasii]|nr:hypothetical protein [Mycobacterium kansasii]
MASASSVGKLSVPAGWSAAVPADDAAATLTGSGWAVPAEEGTQVTTLPAGMPAVAWAGPGGYGTGPRYGVQPKVVPPQVLGYRELCAPAKGLRPRVSRRFRRR